MRPDYTIHLERVFQGPMDLLLHLVREQEVEITEVSISRVISGYLEYLTAMRDLDIADTRHKLGVYSQVGLLGAGSDGSIPLLGQGE